MRVGGGWLLAVPLCALCLAAPAQGATFLAGAARVDTTPPAAGTGHDPPEFASCPAAVFSGPRRWAQDEPYVDRNGNGQFDYPPTDAAPGADTGEPFCDANHNGRYDGIFTSGAINVRGSSVHDPIDARAIAISDGSDTNVVVSVVAQGLFENYIGQVRGAITTARPGVDVVVSASHNESSPDTVGIYGGPNVVDLTGARSGIDDYYMQYLVQQVTAAGVQAVKDLRPATLWADQVPIPANLDVKLSENFPTTADQTDKTFPTDPKRPDESYRPAAIDPKIGVLQARAASGKPIFTVMSLAAHNQEIGHKGPAGVMSSDWPGFFHQSLADRGDGMGMFLVGDNGSEEDPSVVGTTFPEGSFERTRQTGQAFAAAVHTAAARAYRLGYGRVTLTRQVFYPPIENNAFKAAAKAGIFGTRETYVGTEDSAQPAGQAGDRLQSYVSFMDIGPDLQLMMNPGESFPALMLGSPFGIEDAECPNRPNPAIPAWHARAPFRFQVGLADDLIGYEIPAWAYVSDPGVFTTDQCDAGTPKHKHKLEGEGVGPTASNALANRLASLLDTRPDRIAQIRLGRFVHADGSLSRNPLGAIAVWLADRGSTTLKPGTGTLVGELGYAGFGKYPLDEVGFPMDYDGTGHEDTDITSRGMLVLADDGRPGRRWYADVYPALTTTPLPKAVRGEPPAGTPGLPGARDHGLGPAALGLSLLGGNGQLAAPGAGGRTLGGSGGTTCAKTKARKRIAKRHRRTTAHRSAARQRRTHRRHRKVTRRPAPTCRQAVSRPKKKHPARKRATRRRD